MEKEENKKAWDNKPEVFTRVTKSADENWIYVDTISRIKKHKNFWKVVLNEKTQRESGDSN